MISVNITCTVEETYPNNVCHKIKLFSYLKDDNNNNNNNPQYSILFASNEFLVKEKNKPKIQKEKEENSF